MLRWIGDSLEFLLWLGVLQLARLVVVLFCIAEVVGVVEKEDYLGQLQTDIIEVFVFVGFQHGSYLHKRVLMPEGFA